MGGDSSVALQGGWCVCVYFPLAVWLDKGQGLWGLVKNAAYCWSVRLIAGTWPECDWQTKDTSSPADKHWVDNWVKICGDSLGQHIVSVMCSAAHKKLNLKETVSSTVPTHMRGCLAVLSIRGHWCLCRQWQQCSDLTAGCPAAFSAQEGQLPVFLLHRFRGQKNTTQDWHRSTISSRHTSGSQGTYLHGVAHTHTPWWRMIHLKGNEYILHITVCLKVFGSTTAFVEKFV